MPQLHELKKTLSNPFEIIGWLSIFITLKPIILFYFNEIQSFLNAHSFNFMSEENIGAVIALFALTVSFITLLTTKEHNELGVRPLLDSIEECITQNQRHIITFTIINKGLGPAIIKNVKYTYKNDIINDLNTHIKNTLKKYNPVIEDYNTFLKDPIIAKDEKVVIISLSVSINHIASLDELDKLFYDYQISIEHKDIYNKTMPTYVSRPNSK